MLNRQEQYWLECWRRALTTRPETMTRRQRRNCLGGLTHGLYAARILNAEERALVADWQPLRAALQAEYPGESDRIDLLLLYGLFLFRALQAMHGAAIERAGRGIRSHLAQLRRPRPPRKVRQPTPIPASVIHDWRRALVAAVKKANNIAENTGETPDAHA